MSKPTASGAPFTLITTHRVPKSRVAEVKSVTAEYSRFICENEPSLLAFSANLNADESELTLVHTLSNAEQGDAHLRLAHEHIGAGLALVPTATIQVYGEPGPVVSGAIAANAENGAEAVVVPAIMGFLRT